MTRAYYNENDEFAADWLRNLIKAGLIADGEVDTRSIVDVRPGDLAGFVQCHFFAGIGGWSYALRGAGWPDDIAVWTGSCPCQPFSLAGKQKGFSDERHLWPVWRELIRECDPAIVFGEQVASATEWLGLVRGDLEAMGRAVGAMPIQAASAGADHLRDRYWFVADADDAGLQGRGLLPERTGQRAAGPDGVANADQSGSSEERQQRSREQCGPGCDPSPCDSGDLANRNGMLGEVNQDARGSADGDRAGEVAGLSSAGHVADASSGRRGGPGEGQGEQSGRTKAFWPGDSSVNLVNTARQRGNGGEGASGPNGRPCAEDASLEWVIGADGKARRVKPGIRLLAHGVPNRVGLLRGFGNAIDHRPAKEFIQAYMTTRLGTEVTSHDGKVAT